MQNFIQLSAAVHELSCPFLPNLAMVKNPKIVSCDLDLWPITLKFSGYRGVVKEHVRTKFHQVECSGSWVILRTEKNLRRKQ